MKKLSKKQIDSVLSSLKAGHDLLAISGEMKLSTDQIDFLNEHYSKEILAAFRTGTARLRSKIMENAIDNKETSAMLKLLEIRESPQCDTYNIPHLTPELKAILDDMGVGEIERVIVPMICENCGQPALKPKPSLATNASIKTPLAETDSEKSIPEIQEKPVTESDRHSYLNRKWDPDRKCFV